MTSQSDKGLSLMNRVRLEQQAKVVARIGRKGGPHAGGGKVDPFRDLKERIHEEIIQEIDPTILDSKDNTDIVNQIIGSVSSKTYV